MLTTVPQVLVLDAMGVIYQVGDDVTDLLVPFIREKSGTSDLQKIEAAYLNASLGQIDADEFWKQVELSPSLENEYLVRFTITTGLGDLLPVAITRFERIVCLSNDVSRWSRKLRQRYELEPHITGWYISGDLGVRKPDAGIYRHMLSDLGVTPSQVLFVDDRTRNLDAAAQLGIQTGYYNPSNSGSSNGHRTLNDLQELVGK